MNLKATLEKAAEVYGAKAAIIIGERHVSFAEFERDSNKVANALREMGISKGDRVATMQASNPEFVTVFFGILKLGAVAVPLDSRFIADELEILFEDCQPKVLVADSPPLEGLIPHLPRFKSIEHIVDMSGQHDGRFTAYEEIIKSSPATPVTTDIDPQDAALISYTGGPTNRPHGVVLSHYSLYTEALNSGDTFEQTEDDVLMAFALPMYHQFGLTSVLLASFIKGSTMVVVPGTGRSIHNFMAAVEEHQGTIYMGVPYIYALMINVARKEGIEHDLSSLRICAAGGAPLEAEIIRQFQDCFGIKILDIWGQTESISHVTVPPLDGSGKMTSCGKPMACWELKIFDEDGRELPPFQTGEIVLRGPYMTGFYNKPEATAKVLKGGWLYTGDTGHVDEEGSLFITGRSRRMLILKGQNIFPEDIEDVLATHPAVAEVKVIGVPDLVRGETVRALVRLKPGQKATEAEIRQYCQGRMADYKLPREVQIVDNMPEETPVWKRQEVLG